MLTLFFPDRNEDNLTLPVLQTNPSTEGLRRRITAEIGAAAQRIQGFQTEAGQCLLKRENQQHLIDAAIHRVEAILQPRLTAFVSLNPFDKIVPVEHSHRTSSGELSGKTWTLPVPPSDRCTAKVSLCFTIAREGLEDGVILEYHLEILPIFLEFQHQDQLLLNQGASPDESVALWIDDKLVEFTRTYFEMTFHEQYQKKTLERDPVLNLPFPRAFAAGKQEYQGQVYYFQALDPWRNSTGAQRNMSSRHLTRRHRRIRQTKMTAVPLEAKRQRSTKNPSLRNHQS